MDKPKSKAILREGYVVCKEEKLNSKPESLYCVLKPNTLSFHQRKVHKRHTPLGLLKLGELTVDIEEDIDVNCNYGNDAVDCNHNRTRFPLTVQSAEYKLLLYCASFADRTAWVDAIEAAKTSSCCGSTNFEGNDGTSTKDSCNAITERANEQSKFTSEVNECVENHQLLDLKSVDNYSHTACEQDDDTSGTIARSKVDSFHYDTKKLCRVRSRSLSEVEKPSDVVKDSVQYTRYIKSKSAPPDNGKRGCKTKTVDKLRHTGFCRQLARCNLYVYKTII